MNGGSSWRWLALASAFFAGLTAILSKIGVEKIPSNDATLLRTLILIPFLVALVWARHEWQPLATISHRTLLFLTLSGLATGLSWLCYYRALQVGPAALVASIDKLSLIFAVLFAVAFLGERLSVLQWSGAALMTAGTLLLTMK